MPALPELQRAFAAGILDEDPAAIAGWIRAGRFAPERCLQIYRNNVFASLTQALKDVYPVVTRLVSEGFLDYAADAYVRRHPPRSGNLHDFGGEFPVFLAAFEPARALTYLPDVARLEWAWHVAFHAADAPGGEHAAAELAGRLAAIDPARYGGLRFRLHPSARLIASPFPVHRIWEVNQPGYRGDPQVDLAEGPARVLVIRRQDEVVLQALSCGEHALLAAIAAGESFQTACEQAMAAEGELDLGRSFYELARNGTVVGLVEPKT